MATTPTPVTHAVEVDEALPATRTASRAVTLAVETDTAFVLRPTGSYPTAQADTDVSSAFAAIPVTSSMPVTVAVDAQVAEPLRPTALGNATIADPETDTALVLRPTGSYPTGIAADYELALPLIDLVDDQAEDDAITDGYRTPIVSLRADWNRAGVFDHAQSNLGPVLVDVSVTRELSGVLPAEVGFVEGQSAATITATLGGSWPPVASGNAVDPDPLDYGDPTYATDVIGAFAPYRPDAALYGRPVIGTPVELETGFATAEGPVYHRRFTGTVSQVSPHSADREVSLNGVDTANMLRAPITIPAVGLDGNMLARYGPGAYFSRINSQWLIDYILRRNSIYASPPAPDEALIAATMHGSTIPEVGTGGVPQEFAVGSPQTSNAWIDDGHPFGMLYPNPLAPAMVGQWNAPASIPMTPGQGAGFSAWVRMPAAGSAAAALEEILLIINLGVGYDIKLEIFDGELQTYAENPSTLAGTSLNFTPAADPTWMFIGAHFAFLSGNQVAITLRWDGADLFTAQALTLGTNAIAWFPTLAVIYQTAVPMTNISVWSDPFPPVLWTGESWISDADLDPGLNELTGVPALAGEDSWSLLTEVVAAEFGAFGFDENGRGWFRSRAVEHPATASWTVTAQRELADMVTTTDESSIRNAISTTTTPLLVGDYEWVFQSTELDQLQTGSGTTYYDLPLAPDTVIFDSDLIDFIRDVPTFRDALANKAYNAYVLVSIVNFFAPTTYVDPTLVDLAFFRKDATTLTVRIVNRTGVTISFQTANTVETDGSTTYGEPAFAVPGRRLATKAALPQVIADDGSIETYGSRAYDISSGNRWHQHAEAVAGVGEAMLGSVGHPVPVLDAVEVTHDPRRKLFDLVTVVDDTGLGSVTGTLAGITTTYTAGPALDKLTVRPLAPPGLGLWDHPQLGLIGSTLAFGP